MEPVSEPDPRATASVSTRKRRIVRKRKPEKSRAPVEVLGGWLEHKAVITALILISSAVSLWIIWRLAVLQTESERRMAEQSMVNANRLRDLFTLKDGPQRVTFRSDGVANGLGELPTTDSTKVITALRTLALIPPPALARDSAG